MSPDRSDHALASLTRQWNELSLGRQFFLAGSAVLAIGMVVIGVWVSEQIKEGVTRNAAITTAHYVDSVIAPLLPDLRKTESLGEGPRLALDEVLSQGALGQRLVSFKIWKQDGYILYAKEPLLIGRTFEPSDGLKAAWNGSVTAEFDDLSHEESALESAAGVPLLEIYSPIREPWSGTVVAVAEFYESAADLDQQLVQAKAISWLVVAVVTLAMMGLLSGIVLQGSRVISQQRIILEKRVAELSALAQQNEDLRLRVQRASRRATDLNERFLRRVSADLHDGPAQLVALAALRMGSDRLIADGKDGAARKEEISAIRDCLDEAIAEIRSISHGLTLPQIENTGTGEVVKRAVSAHQQRTGDPVSLVMADEVPHLAASEKICIYRFLQEALNNAHRHAPGAEQAVQVQSDDGHINISVADNGPGFNPNAVKPDRLGLAGLRDRVESIGGSFDVGTSSQGTRLTMRLHLDERADQ